MHAWPLWFLDALDWNSGPRMLYSLLSFIIALFYYSIHVGHGRAFRSSTIFAAITLFFAFLYMYGGVRAVVYMLQYTPLFVMLEDKKYASEHINFLSVLLAIILVPGIAMYIYDITVGLPRLLPIEHPFSEYYSFFFYGFYMPRIAMISRGLIRFSSFFLEPSYLAFVIAVFLYARKFDLKNKVNIIMLVALLLSFSLLGYISVIVLSLYWFYCKSKNLKYLFRMISLVVLFMIGFWGAQTYNGGNNIVNELIVQRLLPDEEKGISGNNRNNAMVDEVFNRMVNSGEILTGVGSKRVGDLVSDEGETGGNAGYKLFMITNGVVSVFIFMLLYFFMGPSQLPKGKRQYGWGCMLLGFFSFLSIGVPESWMVLLPFVLTISSNRNEVVNSMHYAIMKKNGANENRNFNLSLRS